MKIFLTEKIKEEIKSKFIHEKISFSPNLGISNILISKKTIEKIPLEKIKGDFIYMWNGKELFKLAVFDKHFFRLRAIESTNIPILEIDGFRMHLTDEFSNPFEYAKRLSQFLNINKGSVLDCFAGLGYVSIELAKSADSVLAVEKNKPVLDLAKENPYSKEFFQNKKMHIINKDIIDYIKETKESFDFIIADPPSYRMKESKDFYTEKFILSLFSKLNFGGKMYFYSGKIAKGKIEKILVKNKISYSYDEKMLGFFIKKAF